MKKLLLYSILTMVLGVILSVFASIAIQKKETGGIIKMVPAEEYDQYTIEEQGLPEEVEWRKMQLL